MNHPLPACAWISTLLCLAACASVPTKPPEGAELIAQGPGYRLWQRSASKQGQPFIEFLAAPDPQASTQPEALQVLVWIDADGDEVVDSDERLLRRERTESAERGFLRVVLAGTGKDLLDLVDPLARAEVALDFGGGIEVRKILRLAEAWFAGQ